jgi:lanthanide-dependent methanol dehydrogenase
MVVLLRRLAETALVLTGAALLGSSSAPAQQKQDANNPSADLLSMEKDPNQWVMAQHDYGNSRFSRLDQINNRNVEKLQLAWTFSVGVDHGQEAAPLVIGDTLYIVAPYDGPHPNEVFALDAKNGDVKWTYSPKPDLSAVGVACCDVVSRGLGYDNGKIFLNTLDDYSVALDANTGKELWHTKLGDINKGETVTMAPLVVKGKVLIGDSGGELGVRGWLTAVDENTGKIVWRAYSTGPDKDVLIGKDFKAFYPQMNGKNLGVSSWPPDAWKIGGGTVWGWLQYDPDLNLVYYGTSNAGPWNEAQRPGDNLWTTAIFARDPDTGEAKWAYQVNPHELWDHDSIGESILLDATIDGKTRKVMAHVNKNGYLYIIDRTNGEVISAHPFVPLNEILKVDLKTGRPEYNPALEPHVGKATVGVCPTQLGGKDWQPSSYSPETGWMYIPAMHLCMNWYPYNTAYIAGTPFNGAVLDSYAPPGTDYRGELEAWDPISQKHVWGIHEKFPVYSGTVATAGGLVFYGTLDRLFKAVDAKTGTPLWQFRAPAGIIGQPITYAVDGVQYVAVLCGPGGGLAAVAIGNINPRDRNTALGTTGAVGDLPSHSAGGSDLLVFALPPSERSAANQSPGGKLAAQ